MAVKVIDYQCDICNIDKIALISIIFITFVVNNLNRIYMKELVSKIQEVYATFSTDAALQIEKATRPQGPVPVRPRWNWKN